MTEARPESPRNAVGSQSQSRNTEEIVQCDFLATVRKAITESGHNNDSIAACIHIDRSLVSRTLNNDRPSQWAGALFVLSLPIPVQRAIAGHWYRYLGGIAVEPDRDKDTAGRHLMQALIFILGGIGAGRGTMEEIIRGVARSFGLGKKRMARCDMPKSEKQEIA